MKAKRLDARTLPLALMLAVLGCDKPPTCKEQANAELSALRSQLAVHEGACKDWYHATADRFGGECPRADQTLTFEQDSDKDAYAVCRCRLEKAKAPK